MIRIGLDVGGTFTDFTLLDERTGALHFHKIPSTPDDPSEAIRLGLTGLLDMVGRGGADVAFLAHGTTVATNMVVEQRGARTGLLTTRGFRDILEIGRQTRPNLYDYRDRNPDPVVPRERRYEITERVRFDGTVEQPLDTAELETAANALRAAGVEAIAICFLHSYRDAAHEQTARAIVERLAPGCFLSLSSDVLPEFREFERTSTTAINAYVGPRMAAYCAKLETDLAALGLPCNAHTFHSNGGLVSMDTVRRFPVRTCLSGPAAGVVGAAVVAKTAGEPNIVTFDVGGTSTDVSLIRDTAPQSTSERQLAGYPIKTPMLDIHVIGAGGGSIAWIDPAGALKVGPQSAGAKPGPVAYGAGGEEPTVTDANLCLNRLSPGTMLPGRMQLDGDAARAAIEREIADPLGLSIEQAAHGILRIAVSNMSRAIRSVSTMQGYDLKGFTLMAFGGAGPLHASEVAIECNIPRIIVPREPGTMCARGMLLANVSFDFVRTVIRTVNDSSWTEIRQVLSAMRRDGDDWLSKEGIVPQDRRFRITLDTRYQGQNHEVPVVLAEIPEDGPDPFIRAFEAAHRQTHGHAIEGRAIEIVNCRVQAVGIVPKAEPPMAGKRGDLAASVTSTRSVYFEHSGWLETPVYDRNSLPADARITGPAVVEEMSATSLILPRQCAWLDPAANLIIDMVPANPDATRHD
jgi:N-methylhydantoinase A